MVKSAGPGFYVKKKQKKEQQDSQLKKRTPG